MLGKAAILLAVAALAAVVRADMYDLVFPTYLPGCKCAEWTSAGNASYQPVINRMWKNGTIPTEAKDLCAMPAASSGAHECDCSDKDETITDSFAGPWCFCANPADGWAQYCSPPKSHVEQLNLQIGAPDVVVASFVTYEALPAKPPMAMMGLSADQLDTTVTGVSHFYQPPNRTYVLHFVKFAGLQPSTTYYYKVKSGSEACEWSAVYSFRSGYSAGVTRLATYGDMGHSHHNNMENMKDDCAAGRIDAIVHMGDHCYNMGMADDRRGDAYMNAFQPTLSGCPWFPIIGNHEAADGDHYNRYINITWGEEYGNEPPVHSTATSALGHLLTKATLYGMGVHGSVPSQTSRYVSADFGLIHMVGLDLNRLDADQLAWLKEDLAYANKRRDVVPWIMVMSHFPLYHTLNAAHPNSSAEHYRGDEAEEVATEGHEYFPCDTDDCETLAEFDQFLASALAPILHDFGVDIYNAGHVHDYESTWPICNGSLCGQKDYTNPKGTVHITEGNGGVPGVVGTNTIKPCGLKQPWCRTHGTGGAYGRITAYNATHLQYDHVENPTGNVTDSFMIVQASHGPFPSA